MMEIYAKSDGETLATHTDRCCRIYSELVNLFPDIDTRTSFPGFYELVLIALFFHDFGKSSAEFQKLLLGHSHRWNRYRHEILSAAFINQLQLTESVKNVIKVLILVHHKDIESILMYREDDYYLGTPFTTHLEYLQDSLPYIQKMMDYFPGIMESFGFGPAAYVPLPSHLEYTKKDWEEAILWMNRIRQTFSPTEKIPLILAKGMINGSDYLASAGVTNILRPVQDISQIYPYEHLTRVQDACRRTVGDAIVISPTGSGKTEASLFWASHNLNRTKGSRIFYALPYTASINAMYIRLRDSLQCHYLQNQEMGVSGGEPDEISPDFISLLHGKASYFLSKFYADKELSDHLKKISKLICSPYKIITPHQVIKHFFSFKGYEMGFLEMYQGVFILDEIHSYEARTVAQILGICEFLQKYLDARILLMSATLPSFIRELFITRLHIQNVITMDREEQEGYTRHECRILEGTLQENIPIILHDIHSGKRVLVVCNTVNQAQSIYIEIEMSASSATLLHSRFIIKDREKIERVIKEGEKMIGGKINEKPLQLLVGTQAIEVSLDIDYDVCYSEPAPIDALIQRFGRVNRRRKNGICPVYVCTKGSESDKYVYDLKKVKRTLDLLSGIGVLHEWKVQKIVDSVYYDQFGDKQNEFDEVLFHFRSMISDIKPFTSTDSKESDYFDQFDSIEVVPIRFQTNYLDDESKGDYLASVQWTLRISKRQYANLKHADRIVRMNNTVFIDARYDDTIGLCIHEQESNIE